MRIQQAVSAYQAGRKTKPMCSLLMLMLLLLLLLLLQVLLLFFFLSSSYDHRPAHKYPPTAAT